MDDWDIFCYDELGDMFNELEDLDNRNNRSNSNRTDAEDDD